MDFTFFFSIQEFSEGGMSKTFLSKFLLVYFFLALKIFFFFYGLVLFLLYSKQSSAVRRPAAALLGFQSEPLGNGQ